MRVCLDTNVLVAAFATRGLCADVLRAVLAEHDLVVGEVILDEVRHILSAKFGLPPDRITAVEGVLTSVPVVARPAAPDRLRMRDPDDAWIVATAVAGSADVLVTGDQDLLAVADDAPIPIVTPRQFWQLLRESSKG